MICNHHRQARSSSSSSSLLLLLGSWCCLLISLKQKEGQAAAATPQNRNNNNNKNKNLPPSHITLRAGILHAPPFAIISEQQQQHPSLFNKNDGSSDDDDDDDLSSSSSSSSSSSQLPLLQYSGFQIDLLQRLQIFAKQQDNVTLQFELDRSPSQYGAALDLIANDCGGRNHDEIDDDTSTTTTTTKTNDTTALLAAAHHADDDDDNADDECQRFDLIVGDYYCNPDRSLRIDFTPSWLRTTMSTVKYIGGGGDNSVVDHQQQDDFTTLTQASNAGATVCVPDGTYLMNVVMEKFPKAQYLKCPSPEDCLKALEAGECVLYADDELLLRWRASNHPTSGLEVTREQFNTQYLVWPMRYDLDPTVALYMKKWMYSAVANATLDELYYKYFQKEQLCPVGTAGEDCSKPCDPVHGTANAQGVCVCQSVKWTGDDCSIEVPEETNLIPDTLKILSYIMVLINFVTIILCGSWLFCQRNSIQVRVSQPFFLSLVLLGCAISTATILAMGQEQDDASNANGMVVEEEGSSDGGSLVNDDDGSCMAIPWLYSVGFSITFGSLFAKIRRIYCIFKWSASPASSAASAATTTVIGASNSSASTTTRKTSAVTFQETIGIIGLVLLIDIFVLTVWTVVEPLQWHRSILRQDQFGIPLESQGYCTSDHWMIFAGVIGALHLTLMGIACYLCFVARAIPTKFSEGKYVTIAMISNLQIFLVGVPVLVILGASPQSSFFVRSVIIWMNDFVVVSLIFGNLIYSVHFKLEEAEPEAVKAAIGQAIQSFSDGRSGRGSSSFRTSPRVSKQQQQQHTSQPESQQTWTTVNSPAYLNQESAQASGQLSLNGSNGHLAIPEAAQRQHFKRSSNLSSYASSSQQSCSQSCKEITLTKSELEQYYSSLRRGESARRLQESNHSAFTTPLPRSLLNSSVSTQLQGNLGETMVRRSSHTGSTIGVRRSSHSGSNLPKNSFAEANLPNASTVSTSNDPSQSSPGGVPMNEAKEDDSEAEEEKVSAAFTTIARSIMSAPQSIMSADPKPAAQMKDVLEDERESWGGINLSMFSDHSRRQPNVDVDYDIEEAGGGGGTQTMHDTSRTSTQSRSSMSSSTRLPPANLPQDGPSRLAYAASRINDVRKDGSKSTHGSTVATGNESFHDETDLDASDTKVSMKRDKRRSSARTRRSSSRRRSSATGSATGANGPELRRTSTSESASSQGHRGTADGANGPELRRTSTSDSATSQRRQGSVDGENGPELRRTSTAESATSQRRRGSVNGADGPELRRTSTAESATSQRRRGSVDGTKGPSLKRTSTGDSATSQRQQRAPPRRQRRRSSAGGSRKSSGTALGGREMDISDPSLYYS